MEFRILGPVEVTSGGHTVAVGGRRERSLLALLLLSANQVVSSERLAEELWPAGKPEGAAHALRVAVSRLRKALRETGADAVLMTRPPGYVIAVGPEAVDAARFEALVAEARERAASGDHHQAAETLRQALGLWRGRALADLADAPFAQAEAARLEEARLVALEDRVDADLACGRHIELAPELDALTRAHPLRERFWGQRMLALYRAGRQADALRSYQELRRLLVEELGIEPSPRLAELESAILRHESSVEWTPALSGNVSPARAAASGVVTFVFTDLVGSTELLARLGDDAAEVLRRTHFSILRHAIEATNGEEVKTLGDGVMAAFASPLDALRCAVQIQLGVDEHNRDDPARALGVRVGIHAGEPLEDDADFHGTPVVVARRLCDAGGGGRILASDLVRGLIGTRGRFRFRRIGPVRLKGIPEPVPTVEVEWRDEPLDSSERPIRRVPRLRPTAPRGPRLVGREPELALLQEELHLAETGEFRCVLLVGEGGVGKTRLANELVARHAEDTTTLSARAYPLGATSAFGVWAEALDRHLRALPGAEVAELAGGVVDDLATLLRSAAAVRGAVPERDAPRARLLEALAVLVSNVAASDTVVVLLDDVHLADASSWDALAYLAHNLPEAAVLVVAAARPAELAAHPVASQILLGLEQEGLLRRLRVEPLGREALVDLASEIARQPVPTALVDWLAERSRGNPLFAASLLRALLEEGADLAAPSLRRLPEELSERIHARLRALPEASLSTLETLAVAGRRVLAGELITFAGRPLADVATIVEDLVSHRFVAEEQRGHEVSYEIVHPLVAEAIYEHIGLARRRILHRQIGRALLDTGGLSEAAPHYARSAETGDSDAIEVLCDAIRQAEEREAYREVLGLLGELVELLPPGDPRWVTVGDAMSLQADWIVERQADAYARLAIRALREIDGQSDDSVDPARRAAIKFRLATFLSWGVGKLDEAEPPCREASRLFEVAGDTAQALLADNELAWIRVLRWHDLAAFQRDEAGILERAGAAGAELAVAQARYSLAIAAMLRGRFSEANTAFETSIAVARAAGKIPQVSRALAMFAMSLAHEGRLPEAQSHLEEAKAINPAYRNTPLLEWGTVVLGEAGDLAGAIRSAEEALAWSPQGVSRRRAVGMACATLAAAEAGRLADAHRFLAHGRAAFGDSDWLVYHDHMEYAGGVLAWREGRPAEALSVIRHAAERLLGVGALPLAAHAFVDLAEIAGMSGDSRTVVEAARRLAEIAVHLDRRLYDGLAAIAAAWSAGAVGANNDAVASAKQAVELLPQTGCRLFLGRALELLGRALSDLDPQAAGWSLRQAAEIFEGCGALWRRERTWEARKALEEAGA